MMAPLASTFQNHIRSMDFVVSQAHFPVCCPLECQVPAMRAPLSPEAVCKYIIAAEGVGEVVKVPYPDYPPKTHRALAIKAPPHLT